MIKRIKTYFSYLYNYLKDIWFFIYTKKDLKLDFPFPPKPFYRVFKIVFWKRFFPHYRRRKKSELKFSDINEYWSKEQWKQDDYLTWLVKTFEKQYPTVTSDFIFKKYYDLKTSKILEVGCGSGHSAACLLSYFINQSYLERGSFDDLNHIEYVGMDLSKIRIKTANLFLPAFLNNAQLIIAVSPPFGIFSFPDDIMLSTKVDPDLGIPIIKIGFISMSFLFGFLSIIFN